MHFRTACGQAQANTAHHRDKCYRFISVMFEQNWICQGFYLSSINKLITVSVYLIIVSNVMPLKKNIICIRCLYCILQYFAKTQNCITKLRCKIVYYFFFTTIRDLYIITVIQYIINIACVR